MKYLTDHDCKPPITTENYDKLPQSHSGKG
jgi:hypothetical protein